MKSLLSLFVLFLLLLVPMLDMAQVKVTTGQPYKVTDARYKAYFKRGADVFSIKVEKEEVIIQNLSSSKLTLERINISREEPGFKVQGAFEYNNKYYLFYSLWNRAEVVDELFCQEIDFDNCTLKKESSSLVKVKGKITGYRIYFSKDEEKMLVQYEFWPDKGKEGNDFIGFHVFGKKLEKLWGKEVEMPYKKMKYLDYSIDGKGNAYILAQITENDTDQDGKKEGSSKYHIEVLKIQANTKEINKTNIKLENKGINTISLFEVSDDYVTAAGFYYNAEFDIASGVIVFKISQECKVTEVKSYPMKQEVLNMYKSKTEEDDKGGKKKRQERGEFQDLILAEINVTKDGGLLLVGEQQYWTTETYKNQTLFTCHFNDLLITKVDSSGKLAWMKKLPKRQFGVWGQGAMSYKYMFGGDSHYFIYVDNEDNLTLNNDILPLPYEDGKPGFVAAYRINNQNGAVRKISILDMKEVGGSEVFKVQTNRMLPITEDQFLIEVYKKKNEDMLIKVDFQNK